jgi:hypothetical protein
MARLLSLLTRWPILDMADPETVDTTCMSDLEATASLLHLNTPSGRFCEIAEGLDYLASLNFEVQEVNEDIIDMIEYNNSTYERIRSQVQSLENDEKESHPDEKEITEVSSYASLKIPSEEHLAKYSFLTRSHEEHLEKLKVFPYYQPADVVLSKRMRQQDMDSGIVTNLDRCMTSREEDAVLSLKELDEVSRSIVELRRKNDQKEAFLNLEYNYFQTKHLIHSADHVDGRREKQQNQTLTDKIIAEIKVLEAECVQMDNELSRIMHQSYHNY